MPSSLTRRDFLKASGLVAAWSALLACNTLTRAGELAASVGPTPTPGASPTPWPTPVVSDDALIAHTLRRISFGPTPEMFDRARSIGLDNFIEEQLHPEALDDAETDRLLGRFSTLTMTAEERLELEQRGRPGQELIGATLLRQWRSTRQLYEVVVDFWSNHFNISLLKDLCRALKTDDDLRVIRPNALGKFGDLLNASARSPAMLVYLDQAHSTKDVPNENYARELMELHTISVEAGYAHRDVEEVARAFTGWSVVGPRRRRLGPLGTYAFIPEIHDDGEKHVLDLRIPAGGGESDGQLVLDYLAAHPMTAQFIGKKLARRFVADNPPDSLVTILADKFAATGGDIRELLRALLRSDEFKKSVGQKVKRPLEFFISALRVTGMELAGQPRALVDHLLLGQVPFFWSPPDGYPDYADWWMTTSGLLNRWNFGLLLTGGMIKGVRVDVKALTKDAASPADVVDLLSLRFVGETLPDDARDILIDFASAGDLGQNAPLVAGLILGSPHFQVR